MGILEECLAPITTVVPGAKIDAILKTLNKEDRQSLEAALREKSISPSRISDVLSKRGMSAGRDSINSWRKREGVI